MSLVFGLFVGTVTTLAGLVGMKFLCDWVDRGSWTTVAAALLFFVGMIASWIVGIFVAIVAANALELAFDS